MKIFQLVDYACKDTISILKVLLAMAVQGKLRGLIVLYRTDDGSEESVYTGVYKANSRHAASATLSMSMELMRSNGEIERRV